MVAREDFGKHCGKVMLIVKSWYGLKTSAAAWAEHLVNTLFAMGFKPSKADPNVWMRRKGEQYEYVTSYVDNLCGTSHDVMALMEEFKQHYSLKGVESPIYCLGGDIVDLSKLWKDEGLVIGLSASTYIQRIVENFEREIG